MSNLSVSAQIELRQKQNELMALSNKETLTPSEKRKFDSLLASISLLKSGAISDEVRNAEADRLAKEIGLPTFDRTEDAKRQREERAALRKMLSTNGEYRTYSPLVSSGSPVVPQGFIKRVAEAQMSAGPLFAGSPLLTDVTGSETSPSKIPTMDDTTATGYVQTEGEAETEVNPVAIGNVTSTLSRFSSGILLYSMELSQDVTTFDSLSQILANALGKRVGRIQNATFLASLLTTLASNSSAAVDSASSGVVGYDDIATLVGSVNAAYRASASAGFIMNSATALELAKIEDSAGRPIMRHVLGQKPTLLGYPVFFSDYADSIATGNKPVLFGDFSTLYSRATDMEIKVFTERYIDQGSFALLARRRSDIKYVIQSTSDSAIKYISVS